MEREEISRIAKEAADKVVISKRCKELGEMILDVKQDLWHAMDNLRETRELNLPYGFELARIWAEGAKRRYMTPFWTPEFTTEELVLLNAPVEKGLKLIKEGKDIEAAFAFEEARKAAHEMLFQKVVECECGEAKAIEKHLGEEALEKILATRYVTIADPGKTIFSRGNVVSEESFKKENDRVTKLGEAPATKEGSNPGVPYQEEGERIALQLGNGVIYNGPQMDQDKIYAHIFTDVAVTGTTFACLGFKECCARLIQVRKDFGADLPIFEGAK